MSNKNPADLNDEVLDRWHWFYRKGLIGRRDMLRALAVAGGGAALAACAPAAPAPAKPDAAPAKPAEAAKPAAPAAADPYGKPAAPLRLPSRVARTSSTSGSLRTSRRWTRTCTTIVSGSSGTTTSTTTWASAIPNTNRIVPHLATSWKPVEPTVWEVELRKDVKFHNGDPFDAETVKFELGTGDQPGPEEPAEGQPRGDQGRRSRRHTQGAASTRPRRTRSSSSGSRTSSSSRRRSPKRRATTGSPRT